MSYVASQEAGYGGLDSVRNVLHILKRLNLSTEPEKKTWLWSGKDLNLAPLLCKALYVSIAGHTTFRYDTNCNPLKKLRSSAQIYAGLQVLKQKLCFFFLSNLLYDLWRHNLKPVVHVSDAGYSKLRCDATYLVC
jgi:hypothetical protein